MNTVFVVVVNEQRVKTCYAIETRNTTGKHIFFIQTSTAHIIAQCLTHVRRVAFDMLGVVVFVVGVGVVVAFECCLYMFLPVLFTFGHHQLNIVKCLQDKRD